MGSTSKRRERKSFAKRAKKFMNEHMPAVLLLLICITLLSVSTAIDKWYYVMIGESTNMTHYNVGLWSYSSEETDRKDNLVEGLFNDLKKMAPILIVVLFLHVTAMICLLLRVQNIKKQMVIYAAKLLVILNIILLLVVLIVYITFYLDHKDKIQVQIGLSFVLMTISFVLEFFELCSLSYNIYKERRFQKYIQENLKNTKFVLRNQESLIVNGELFDIARHGKENNNFEEEKACDKNQNEENSPKELKI